MTETAPAPTPTTASVATTGATSADTRASHRNSAAPNRRIILASAPNMRDLGGLPVEGGVVRNRQVIRSATLAKLSDEDLPHFEGLGVTTIYDLRTSGERRAAPDRTPQSIALVGLDVLADSKVNIAASMQTFAQDTDQLAKILDSGTVSALLEQSYRDIVSLPSAQGAYRAFFSGLAHPERTGAALFHCTTGKDRTGWAAASLLLLLGADDATIRADYLQTNVDLMESLQPIFDVISARGIGPDQVRPLLGVQNSYLDAAFEQLESEFGTVESYFTTGLGLDAQTVDRLRDRLIDPSAAVSA